MKDWDAQTNEQLCEEYQKTKNNDLFEYFLSRNYGLIEKYMGPIINKHPEQRDELLQRGQIAMWEAMSKFNTTKGFKFTTYLHYYFKKTLWHQYHEQFITHVPINLINHLDEVKEKVPFAAINMESMSKTIISPDNGTDMTLEDTIASDDPSPLDVLISKDKGDRLLAILDELSPRESKCIQMYFGLNGYTPHTLEKIGNEYGVTRERIRQIISKGLKKVKYYLNKVEGGFKYEDW